MMRRPIFCASMAVFEPIADDRGVVVGERHDREQLRLGPGLEAESVLTPEVGDLFDDLPLLVHLDRIHAQVPARIFVLRDRALKRFGDLPQPVLQHAAEPNQQREADRAVLQVVDQLLQINRPRRLFRRTDHQMVVLTDREISVSPA